MWKTRGERGSSCSLQRGVLAEAQPPAFAEKSAREASGGNSRWELCCRVGEEPVELTSAASPHVPDTLPNALPMCGYPTPAPVQEPGKVGLTVHTSQIQPLRLMVVEHLI